jgi:hypothetical protein
MEMEVVKAIEETVLEVRDTYLENNPTERLHHLSTDIAALWCQSPPVKGHPWSGDVGHSHAGRVCHGG